MLHANAEQQPTSVLKPTLKRTLRFYPLVVWLLATAFYFYEFLLQVSPSVMVPDLMQAFHINGTQVGNLAAFYFYAYCVMQIPVGILVDKFGAHLLLTVTSALCACGALLLALTHVFFWAEISRLIVGFGAAFAVIGCLKLITRWFAPNKFALMSGLTVSAGMIGAACGEIPLAHLVIHIGWRDTLILGAILGFIISFLIAIFIRDNHQEDQVPAAKKASLGRGLRIVAKHPQSWLISIYAGLMFAPVSAFAGLWGIPFLTAKYNASRTGAAFVIAAIFVGFAIGAPIIGLISDYIKLRKPVMILGSIGALITMICAIYLNLPMFWMVIVLGIFGFCSSGFFSAFAMIREIHPIIFAGTALGFINMLNMVGGAVLQPALGKMLDMGWDGELSKGVHVFSLNDFHHTLYVLPITIFVALLLLPFIKETHCELVDEKR